MGNTANPASNSGNSAGADHAALETRVETLEHRKDLLEDLNAVKRLQRAYGYFIDRGMWDQAAQLFASDGTIEIGLDGVYVGQKRVSEYLHALLGGGKSGTLAPGQLNEHMQLMPYVTVAPDGHTARGTWRDVILAGRLGSSATWGEGPYENEYVQEQGVWKIRSLHWFQTLTVPYDGGWAKHEDVNGGKYVSSRLPPDRPPTIQYRTWPGGLLPPFHFDHPSAGNTASTVLRSGAAPDTNKILLATRVAALVHDAQLLQDQDDIENLQRIYGYYVDKQLWTQAANLFTDDAQYAIAGRGTYVGKAAVSAYLHAIGPESPQPGRLYDQMQLQPIVNVDPDGKTAQGRWRVFIQAAQAGKFQEWGMQIAENQYRREGGVWKISRITLYPVMFTPFDAGWGKTILRQSSFEPSLQPISGIMQTATAGPGAILTAAPFHYRDLANPSAIYPPPPRFRPATATAGDPAAMAKALDDAERNIGRAEDFSQLENLQMRYGYYLATLEWDRLANLFAADGTIEIALRGMYVGHDSIRRSLNLYGEPGVHEGNLHNHMQFQPVIHVSQDGRTARVRARALSMMGNYEKSGMWMGGIYENQFVKENGVWKFQHDQVFNTYFTPFDQGWKDLQPRPPPGITATNPPDKPPSVQFEMYPRATIWPPYHYANPVTGQAVSITGQ